MNVSSTASLASLLTSMSAGRAKPQPPPDAAQAFGASDETSRAERQQKLFSKIDTDGDGSVTKAELTSHFTSGTMSTLLNAQETSGADIADKIMGDADADGDGALTAAEFAAAPKGGPGGAHGPGGAGGPPPGGPPPGSMGGMGGTEDASSAASDLLSGLDTNGDGVLSAEELAAAFGSTTDASDAGSASGSKDATAQTASASQTLKDAIAALIGEGDQNDDGSLNADELTSLFQARQTERASYGPPPWMAEGLGAYAASNATTTSTVGATA